MTDEEYEEAKKRLGKCNKIEGIFVATMMIVVTAGIIFVIAVDYLS